MTDFTWLINALKAPFYALASCVVLGTFLLFDGLLNLIGAQQFRPWIGLGFVVSLIFLVAQLFILSNNVRDKQSSIIKSRQRLQQLTPDEKRILRIFVANNTRTCDLDPSHATVKLLAHEGIIRRLDEQVGEMSYINKPYQISASLLQHL